MLLRLHRFLNVHFFQLISDFPFQLLQIYLSWVKYIWWRYKTVNTVLWFKQLLSHLKVMFANLVLLLQLFMHVALLD